MRILVLFAVLMVATAALGENPSQLAGAASVTCEGGSHIVRVSGTYYWGIEGEYTSIVLERQAVGICVSSELLTDFATPFEPEPAFGYSADYAFTFDIPVPPQDVVYRYVPYGVKADGSLQEIFHYCDTDWRGYALVDCVDAPFERGTVEYGDMGYGGPSFRIVSCEDDCWTEGVFTDIQLTDFESYTDESPFDLIGEVVDIYGGRAYCAMIGGPYEQITGIERAPSGACGPVPVRQASWGSVKSLYR